MANDLASYRDAVELILDDTANTRYSANQVDQAIRMALMEYNAYTASACTLKDLDSATATSLPLADAAGFQLGAAACALLSRAASQAEANVLQGDASDELRALATTFLGTFHRLFSPIPAPGIHADLLQDFRQGMRPAPGSGFIPLPFPPTDHF